MPVFLNWKPAISFLMGNAVLLSNLKLCALSISCFFLTLEAELTNGWWEPYKDHRVCVHRLRVPSTCARLPLLALPFFTLLPWPETWAWFSSSGRIPACTHRCILLSHLSLVDVCLSSMVGPKMLRDFFAERKAISFLGCALPQWFFGLFVAIECLLLAPMAYDRHVAICNPLLYAVVMSHRLCIQLVVGPYAAGFLNTTTHTIAAFRLPFCGSNIISHFFCDMSSLLSLICADTRINTLLVFIVAGAVLVVSSLTILISYFRILISILSIHSARGRHRAFSTCSSHLTAVSILYETLVFIYMRPGAVFSLDLNKVVAVFYTAVIPMLNPLIYSLRNKEVKAAMRRTFARRKFCLKS